MGESLGSGEEPREPLLGLSFAVGGVSSYPF